MSLSAPEVRQCYKKNCWHSTGEAEISWFTGFIALFWHSVAKTVQREHVQQHCNMWHRCNNSGHVRDKDFACHEWLHLQTTVGLYTDEAATRDTTHTHWHSRLVRQLKGLWIMVWFIKVWFISFLFICAFYYLWLTSGSNCPWVRSEFKTKCIMWYVCLFSHFLRGKDQIGSERRTDWNRQSAGTKAHFLQVALVCERSSDCFSVITIDQIFVFWTSAICSPFLMGSLDCSAEVSRTNACTCCTVNNENT